VNRDRRRPATWAARCLIDWARLSGDIVDPTLPHHDPTHARSTLRDGLALTHAEGDRSPSTPVGDQLGRYPVVGLLGTGGMGEVLAVRDAEIGRDIAAKVIRHGQVDERTVRKFVLEAQVTGQLEHPSIVPVYELGTADGRLYFTMKRVAGQDLAAHPPAGGIRVALPAFGEEDRRRVSGARRGLARSRRRRGVCAHRTACRTVRARG